MRRQAIAAVTVLAAIILTAACGGSSKPSFATPQTTSSAETIGVPTPLAPISTNDICPLDNASLCAAALDIRTAARAHDIDYLVQRLVPSADCTFGPSECPANATGTFVPGVILFNYSSDCCYRSAEVFRAQIGDLLARVKPGTSDPAGPGDWNLLGILTGATFWPSRTAIVLTALLDDGHRWVIELGVQRTGDQWSILGAIKGTLNTYYKFPEAELHRW